MKLLLMSISVQLVIVHSFQIQWNDVATSRWAHRCDFPTNSFYQVSSIGEHCGRHCATNVNCTHFYWELSHGNGTCYLRAGQVAHCNASFGPVGSVCGYFKDRVDEQQICPGGNGIAIAVGGAIGAVALIALVALILVAWKKGKICFKMTTAGRHQEEDNYKFASQVQEDPVYEELPSYLPPSVHPAPRPPAFLPPYLVSMT